jgi:hypothetical protein
MKCESGWTGDRCTFELFHGGSHSNDTPIELTDGSVQERCDVCGEYLRGEIAEVVRNEDVEKPGLETHLIVHESCYDREGMVLA